MYVGGLDKYVDDSMLMAAFMKRYSSVLKTKIIVDPVTRNSKGYGFVTFGNYEDSSKAIEEL